MNMTLVDPLPIHQIGHVKIAAIDRQMALARVNDSLVQHSYLLIAFCNAHTVNLAESDDRLVESLNRALVLNDGIGVDIAVRLLHGSRFRDNLNGTDFTPAVLEHAPDPLRIFLIGGRPGIVERAADHIKARYPRHAIVGMRHGYFSSAENQAVLDDLAGARPDLVLVGMGQPLQEYWATQHLAGRPMVVMCVGALIDFMAGAVPRSPAIIRRIRAEWAFRLMIEPRRLWRRYLIGNARFLARVLKAKFAG